MAAGFAAAAATVDAAYETPAQHHNPMELFQTTCAWDADRVRLIVWESSQNVRGVQHGLALQLGIAPDAIRVVSPVVGGGFGARGRMGHNTALVALAARRLGRPVKHVATRREGFTLRHFRAETRHRLRLGADAQGRLLALDHRSWEFTSRDDRFVTAGSDATARLYACPNIRTLVRNVAADRQAPGFMRGLPETPYLFAMESAMDELAHALDIDPVELRRCNETAADPVTGKPCTSRALLRCMAGGARLFGWDGRRKQPGTHSTTTKHVGWSYATAIYPTQISAADCAVTLLPSGRALTEASTHEIGTGVSTVMAQVVADQLGLPLGAVEVRTGDTLLPAAPITAGSSSTASVCTALVMACDALRARLAAGRIMNTRTAWAQLNGGQVWGISSALHEATELEPGEARYINRDFGEYHFPVAADTGDIRTVMLEEEDPVVPLGIKGLGDLGMTGLNAAVANAVFHATGRRLRRLPIRVGDLLRGAAA